MRITRLACSAAATCGGLLIAAAALLVTYDVLLRLFVGRSTGVADELTGYALGIGSALALGSALIEGAHVRIETVSNLLPRLYEKVLQFIAVLLFAFFMAITTWHAYGVVQQSYFAGSRSMSELRLPLVLPQLAWLFGYILFLVAALVLLIVYARQLRLGQLDEPVEQAGTGADQRENETGVDIDPRQGPQ